MKLTESQRSVLEGLASWSRPAFAYDLSRFYRGKARWPIEASANTCRALVKKGLAEQWNRRPAASWVITPAGRQALSAPSSPHSREVGE